MVNSALYVQGWKFTNQSTAKYPLGPEQMFCKTQRNVDLNQMWSVSLLRTPMFEHYSGTFPDMFLTGQPGKQWKCRRCSIQHTNGWKERKRRRSWMKKVSHLKIDMSEATPTGRSHSSKLQHTLSLYHTGSLSQTGLCLSPKPNVFTVGNRRTSPLCAGANRDNDCAFLKKIKFKLTTKLKYR